MRADPASACLSEDELLALGGGRALGDAPAAEAHLSSCATCSALLAAIVRDAGPRWDDLSGTTLGPYRLDAQIGAGGMGAVYRAWDPRLHRAIAVKVLHTERAAKTATEARAAAAIAHPTVVAIHDVGVAAGVTYVAMELVEGETLRSVITRGAWSVDKARALATELADGLAAAHARGVVHRDLKPENLIVATDGRLRILDFGLAKLIDAGPLDETEPGTIQGTAGYMAPEQARGAAVDARADLFAAGAILYELVTGRRAFDGAAHADRLTATLRDTPPMDGLGPLAPVIARCLAKEPRDRFQSAADLGWALAQTAVPATAAPPVATPTPAARGPSRRTLLLGGGAAAAAVAAAYLVGRRRAPTVAVPARPEFKQLTYRTGRVFTARFSRDGASVLYGAAWDAEPLRIYQLDLAGGGPRPLEVPPADILAVSARGELAVSLGRRFTDHQRATGQLAVVQASGGAPRLLADDVEDADFTPDGRLVAMRRAGTGTRLELPLGTVLVDSPRWLTHPRVSPDGRRIAYLEHPHTNDDAGTLQVIEIATRKTTALAGAWGSIAGLAWDPRGDRIWFTAARDTPHNEVHAVGLDGTLHAVAQTTGRLRLHDLTVDGRAAVSVDAWRLRTFIGGTADEHDSSLSEVSYVSDLSADGTMAVQGETGDVANEIAAYLAPVAGGKLLRLGIGFPLAISPSGRWVAAIVYGDDGARPIAYATTSAEQRPFAAPANVTFARWIDDDSLIAVSDQRIWRLSLTAAPVALTPPGAAGALALDPARRRCAFIDPTDRLHVVDLASGTATALPGDFAQQAVCGWLETGAIVTRSTTTPIVLTRIDPATGAPTPYRTITPAVIGLKAVDTFVLHPSGSPYAYSCGQELSQLHLMTLRP